MTRRSDLLADLLFVERVLAEAAGALPDPDFASEWAARLGVDGARLLDVLDGAHASLDRLVTVGGAGAVVAGWQDRVEALAFSLDAEHRDEAFRHLHLRHGGSGAWELLEGVRAAWRPASGGASRIEARAWALP